MAEPTDQWFPVRDAAAVLGISEDAVRSKIKRRTLRSRKGNDGRVSVLVATDQTTPTDDCPAIGRPLGDRPIEPPAAKPESSGLVSLDDVRALLGEQADRHKAAMEAALDRADRQHQAELARLSAAHRAGVNALMNRVAALLVERRERRSWWKWW